MASTRLTSIVLGSWRVAKIVALAIAWLVPVIVVKAQQPTLAEIGDDYFSDSFRRTDTSSRFPDASDSDDRKQVVADKETIKKLEAGKRGGEILRIANSPLLSAWLQQMVLKNIPEKYVDEKKWGRQKEIFDGLKFEREGLKIETRRRKKQVNHGKWLRYEATVAEPPQENFSVALENVRVKEGGVACFDLVLHGKFRLFGRFARWVNGLQLISVSVNSTATTKARLVCETDIDIQLSPEIQFTFKPTVKSAELSLVGYDVERISYLRGETAETIGKLFRDRIAREIEEYSMKLPEKINEKLAEKAAKLAFPTK